MGSKGRSVKATRISDGSVSYHETQKQAAEYTGAIVQSISACCTGSQGKTVGYMFEFNDKKIEGPLVTIAPTVDKHDKAMEFANLQEGKSKKDTLNYFRLGLLMNGMMFKKEDIHAIFLICTKVMEKGGSYSIRDAARIESFIKSLPIKVE